MRVYLLTFTYSFIPIYTTPNRYLSTPKKKNVRTKDSLAYACVLCV
jgi:hypothetical protein